MDYINDAENTRYVMSLDALDFGILSSTYLSKLDGKPTKLWNANNSSYNSNKYFEFEIGPKNNTMESNSENSTWVFNDTTSMEGDDTTVCHICDIDVPTAYVEDHESSLKHKAYMKIADAVLERSRRHMLSKAHSFVKKDDSMYFCGPCAIALQAANKQNHEKSKAHKQSLSLDRLLYDLVALYTHETYNEKLNMVSKKLCNDNAKEIKSEIESDISNNTVLISDIKARLDMHEELLNDNVKIKETDGSEHIEPDSNNYNGFFKYLHDLTETVQIINNKAVKTISSVETKSINNNKTNCNGVINVTDGVHYFCQACNFTMHVNNIDSHMNGNKHAWNSKSSLHYFMKLAIGSSDLLCKVCDVYVADDVTEIKKHIATGDHVKKYNNLLETNNVVQKQNNLFCKPCNVDLSKGNELYHIEKLSHEHNLASLNETFAETPKLQENNNINNISGTHTDTLKTDIIVNEPTKSDSALPIKATAYHCTVCNVYVPNNPSNIKSHNDGLRHEKNAKKTVSEVADSVKSSDVSSIESTDLHYQMDATDNERQLMCKVCKVPINSREDCVTEHINGKKHDSNFKILIQSNNIVNKIGQQYFCGCCQYYINAENLFIHIASTQHKARLDFDINIDKSELNDSNKTDYTIKTPKLNKEDACVESLDQIYLKVKHHFSESKESDLVICKVCSDLEIPYTKTDIVNHAAEGTHLDEYQELMSEHLIFESEKNTYFCGICTCLVPLRGEVHHVRGARHEANLLIAMNINDECPVCSMNIANTNMIDHLKTPTHAYNVLKKQTLLHYCQHCKTLVPKNNHEEHNRSCHKLAVKGKICFCTTCDPYLPGSQRM